MKGGTKILAIVTIVIILLSISFSGCFEDGEEKDEYEIYFILSIDGSLGTNYTLYIPIPVKSAKHYKPDNYGEPIDFISNIANQRFDSTIIQLDGSYYLNITSNYDFEINKKQKLKEENGNWFSELSSEKCLLISQENISLIINYQTEVIKKGSRSHGFQLENEKIINGWNELDFDDIGFIID
jgi:hypothetical protein